MTFYFQAPDLAEFPRRSYRRFLEETIGNLFAEISPVSSEYSPRFEISFVGQDGKVHWRFEDYAVDSGYPTTSEAARKTNMTHSRRMLMEVWLRDTQTHELRKSTCYVADMPVITDRGTFVINGSERVVLGQLVRAPGIYFSSGGPLSYKGLMLAEQGAPVSIELELDGSTGRMSKAKCRIKLPKRSWIAATTVLTAMGCDEQIMQKRLEPLLERARINWVKMTQQEALAVVGRAWKPDGGGGVSGGATALKELTDKRRYSMGSLGRRRINSKLRIDSESYQLSAMDILAAVEYILGLPSGNGTVDNIDSLENRHLRGIGEVMTKSVRPALAQITRSVRTRLELNENEEIGSPNDLVDCRPFATAMVKFFSGNPLVQYLDQQNPLSELSHRRRITSFGPGGIDPNAAPTEMRDVHPSQIGRVCLVESPEGKNCGLVSYMATYCRIDEDGFMTVPYRKVKETRVTDEVVYITPAEDKRFTLAPPDTKVVDNIIQGPFVSARRGERFMEVEPQEVDLIGIAPQGFISVGSGLIPFLEHDDANRALMGGGMMRQTLPLIQPERPRVGTGMEKVVARSSGHSIVARRAGTVTKVTGQEIVVKQASGETRNYPLIRFDRTNQNTILDQRPNVKEGQRVEAGQIIADGPAIDNGELALGRNLLIAFMPWRGQNFEDAIAVREGLVKAHRLSHIEIEKHSTGVYQTLRGPEVLTPELPNVANKDLEHLDDRGIAKIGSYVHPGDILVSKLSPKEQRALSAEEELLQAIFGKVAEEMGDTSLRVPHGSGGRVIDVRIFTPETTPELRAGVICEIEVLIARLCPLEVGDKLAGRHGNKGIVSIVVPDQDMPYMPDGTPVDLVLNALGVPSRMNVGQVFDTQLGLYSSLLNRYYRIHQFDESISPDASFRLVNDALKEVRKLPNFEWMGKDGKVKLTDGRTGEAFDRPVLVGKQYMLKLNQLVLHKINARSGLGGPYAAVTQQPVGGKANHGGQRMGEMEVWAIQAYGAANLLNEMMTIKADDIQGRHQSYADIVQGNNISPPGRTAAFDGLCCEIRGLGMEMTLGQVVDTFDPIAEKGCTQAPKSLEEQYEVSTVDKLENEGVKILEIPAGDYVPLSKTTAAPVITSVTNGRNGIKPRVEISQEPLIDPLDEANVGSIDDASYLARFIDSATEDILNAPKPASSARPAMQSWNSGGAGSGGGAGASGGPLSGGSNFGASHSGNSHPGGGGGASSDENSPSVPPRSPEPSPFANDQNLFGGFGTGFESLLAGIGQDAGFERPNASRLETFNKLPERNPFEPDDDDEDGTPSRQAVSPDPTGVASTSGSAGSTGSTGSTGAAGAAGAAANRGKTDEEPTEDDYEEFEQLGDFTPDPEDFLTTFEATPAGEPLLPPMPPAPAQAPSAPAPSPAAPESALAAPAPSHAAPAPATPAHVPTPGASEEHAPTYELPSTEPYLESLLPPDPQPEPPKLDIRGRLKLPPLNVPPDREFEIDPDIVGAKPTPSPSQPSPSPSQTSPSPSQPTPSPSQPVFTTQNTVPPQAEPASQITSPMPSPARHPLQPMLQHQPMQPPAQPTQPAQPQLTQPAQSQPTQPASPQPTPPASPRPSQPAQQQPMIQPVRPQVPQASQPGHQSAPVIQPVQRQQQQTPAQPLQPQQNQLPQPSSENPTITPAVSRPNPFAPIISSVRRTNPDPNQPVSGTPSPQNPTAVPQTQAPQADSPKRESESDREED